VNLPMNRRHHLCLRFTLLLLALGSARELKLAHNCVNLEEVFAKLAGVRTAA